MTRKRKYDDDEYDFLKSHIRGIYVERSKFPLDYPPLPKVRLSLSRPSQHSAPEAVFKIASFVKTKEEAARAVLYVAERSEGLTEIVTLYDEERRDLKPEEAKNKLDEINFKAERKDSRKMVHFIVSFPNKMRLSENDVKLFMARYMEQFGDAGYSYLYGVHKHQSAVHGHVLMTLSNGRDPKLRFRKAEIQQMRQHQVEVAKTFGWEMRATMCKDREIRIDGQTAKPKKKTLLERQMPHWYAARKKEESRPFLTRKEETAYPLSEPAKQSLETWAKHFENPRRAARLFVEMYAENQKTAFWYANNRARVFGELPRPPSVKLTRRNFNPNEAEISRFRYKELSQKQRRGLER